MKISTSRKMIAFFGVFLVLIFTFGFVVSNAVHTNAIIPKEITIIIDAGHGNPDGKKKKKNGTIESELNLKYAKTLEKYLSGFGIKVVQTRNDENCLVDENTDNFKIADMQKRAEIINSSGAQILISIHMNKFTQSSENGAQVFFEQDDEDSKKLADSIRNILVANFDNARKLTLAGDYYILNNTSPIGVIVECGFLSNENEEKLLNTPEYMNKMCYSIYAGIINFLGVVNF